MLKTRQTHKLFSPSAGRRHRLNAKTDATIQGATVIVNTPYLRKKERKTLNAPRAQNRKRKTNKNKWMRDKTGERYRGRRSLYSTFVWGWCPLGWLTATIIFYHKHMIWTKKRYKIGTFEFAKEKAIWPTVSKTEDITLTMSVCKLILILSGEGKIHYARTVWETTVSVPR